MTSSRKPPEMADRIAVVTGGAGGIGAAIVRSLARSGHPVAIGYQSSREAAEKLEDELASEGATVLSASVDVGDLDSVIEFIQAIESKLGQPLILINGAGWKRDELVPVSDPDIWLRTLMVNLCGPYFLAKQVLPAMLSARWGRIVNVSSVAGERGSPSQTAYCSSKAGLNGFTRALATEVARRNVLVNAVSPGLVFTEMTKGLTHKQEDFLLNLTPMKRAATPEDIANIVEFLVSDAAGYVTGQIISADGGMVAAH